MPLRHPDPIAAPTRAAFAFIFVTVALDMLALGVVIPVLPKLIVSLEGGNMARAASIAGFFAASWAAMQFIFSPLLGAISDRFGRRAIILFSNFGLGFNYFLMGFAPTLAWLYVGRLFSGIASASISTATAYVADVTPIDQRAARFGLLGAAFGLGFVVGPALGGALGAISLRTPFWAAGALSLLNALYGTFVLPESLSRENRAQFQWRKANPIGALKLLRGNRELWGLALATVCYALAHESLPSMFVLYADYRYHWTASQVGFALAMVGICSTLVSALLVKRVVGRMGERRAIVIGLGFGAIGFSIYGSAPAGIYFLMGIPFVSLWGLAGPSMQALMSRKVGPQHQGSLQGALASIRGITGMIGPLIFTQIFRTAIGHRINGVEDKLHLPGAPYLLAALLLLCAITITWVTTRHHSHPNQKL